MPDVAYLNGEFLPLAEAKVSVNDRGFLFGDAVYEVIAAYSGVPFLLDEHLVRLKNSCEGVNLKAEHFVNELPGILRHGLELSGYPQTSIYIQITRGVQERSAIYPDNATPTCLATFRPPPYDVPALQQNGVRVVIKPDNRWGRCDLKTTNLLANVLLRNEAFQEGAHEAVLVDSEGYVSECSASSLFIVANGALVTRPLSHAILPGMSRDYLIRTLAPQVAVTVREEKFSVEQLLGADEAILTSTSVSAVSIVAVDSEKIGSGKPGPVAQQLIRQWQENIARISSSREE